MNSFYENLEALLSKAKAGDIEAQFALVKVYPDLAACPERKRIKDSTRNWHADTLYHLGSKLADSPKTLDQAHDIIHFMLMSSAQGHPFAKLFMADCYREGMKFTDAEGRSFTVQPVYYSKAYDLYNELSALDFHTSHYWCAWLLLEGKGVPKNEEDGFNRLLKAVCEDPICKEALRLLADCFHKGLGVDPNPYEAYVWAILARAAWEKLMPDDLFSRLESEVKPRSQIKKAQAEAKLRHDLRKKGELTPQYCLDAILPKQKEPEYRGLRPEDRNVAAIYRPVIKPLILQEVPLSHIKAETKSTPILKPKPKKDLETTGWNVEKASEIELILYLKQGNITLKSNENTETGAALTLFSKNSLRLLIMYYDHANKGGPKIEYKQRTVSHAAKAWEKKRGNEVTNEKVVRDFNHEFRLLFGKGKDFKAFEWSPGKINKDLLARFELVVK